MLLVSELDEQLPQAQSSEIRMERPNTASESVMMASMTHLSLSTLNIPECKPSDGELEVDKQAYLRWKEILETSLNLISTTDERTKMGIFKIKAGASLLEIFQSTITATGMPDQLTFPYSNAIARLDGYYGSRAYLMSQRSKLMNMSQSSKEDNIQFVRRVGVAAKLCEYSSEEEMEAIARTITKGTTDSVVRSLAHRNWIKQGSMKDLIDMVRDSEIEKMNEEEFQRKNRSSKPAVVAAVSHQSSTHHQNLRGQHRQAGNFRHFRGNTRGRFVSGQMSSHAVFCWRCRSVYHPPQDCPLSDKVCRTCNRKGHIARACTDRLQSRPTKRMGEEANDNPPRKIAALSKLEDENPETPQVQDSNIDE
ncbi:uncharacterized protein LOC134217763 [Armigeres subalbatus]|uniref:uncharacterized protein LOC134217763 n=1 Tax=Armigeres subalbatus TaxID=124917 RepID=UPI002ED5CE12